ncbi:MAG: VWA domain-containing protein, partial [Thermomicrobiales bacterium]|nr:VWA domain-containing protein [Thermomicrobiales bacterium]
LPAHAQRRVDFLRAVAITELRSLDDLYWVARVTLVAGEPQIEPFDLVFDAWFRRGMIPALVEATQPPDEEREAPPRPEAPEGALPPLELGEGTGRAASPDELANRRRLRPTTDAERVLWARAAEAAQTRLPETVARRRVRSPRRGTVDLRRVLARAVRSGGELIDLSYRRRPRRQRRVVLLIDVSGSLKAHSPDFLRFAHAAVRGGERVEAFTFGTRLTRITPALRTPEVDDALAELSELVFDFDGGTRIGDAFATLLANGRFVSFVRGAVVIVLSDGLERGDPTAMAWATERLARLGSLLVWLTPLMGDPAYRPATRGMQAILDSLDRLGDAHSLLALVGELERLPETSRRPRRAEAARWRNQRRSA